MNSGVIVSTAASLMDAPGGERLATLRRGTPVRILGQVSSWLEVEAGTVTGFVNNRTVDAAAAAVPGIGQEAMAATPSAPAIPPDARPADIGVSGKKVLGPGGIRFGTLFKLGLFNYGKSSIADFFAQDPAAFPAAGPSLKRVMISVSDNEGKLEAINTWDSAFMSPGIFQWTLGETTGAGELAAVLDLLRTRAPAAFKTYFGDLGISVAMSAGAPGTVRRGFLALNGKPLDTSAEKSELRRHIWAYRFWRAAHDKDVRRAQIAHAVSRIDTFYGKALPGMAGRALSDYVTSEFGVALLLDQHVNRPGHVPKTILAAIKAEIASGARQDPALWSDATERGALKRYITQRRATSMTNSDKRADVTKAFVSKGLLSDTRGSFRI